MNDAFPLSRLPPVPIACGVAGPLRALVRPHLAAVLMVLTLLLTGCEGGDDTASSAAAAPKLDLDAAELAWIGDRIFQNECAGQRSCLVHWNVGEAFPSLGIGHFIWYPAGVEGRFVESFPPLMHFLRQRNVTPPAWLNGLSPFDAPWPDRAAFLAEDPSPRTEALRAFLSETRGLQVAYIFQRTREALARVLAAAPADRRDQMRRHLSALAATPGGAYALLDYVNFKGEGLAESERYQGEGWGLLQVLLAMPENAGESGVAEEGSALAAFRQAAETVLTRRAQNAERAIERERWLPGWLHRIDTYREPPTPG